MSGNRFFLVFKKLSIEFVDQRINCGIHVHRVCVGEEFSARNVRGCFCQVLKLLHVKNDVNMSNLVGVAVELFKLLIDVFVDGVGKVDVVA